MKERPILFTPENAQKSHDGLKTETRRLNGLDEINESPNDWAVLCHSPDDIVWRFAHRTKTASNGGGMRSIKCPYGVVGDRLWTKEAWCVGKPALPSGLGIVPYYGPSKTIDRSVCTKVVHRGAWTGGDQPKWRSGMLMPRWACRTVLELTGVRVERLQDISVEDIKAEGVEWADEPETKDVYMQRWRHLWKSIYGPGSWDANPWVWVLEFKRVDR